MNINTAQRTVFNHPLICTFNIFMYQTCRVFMKGNVCFLLAQSAGTQCTVLGPKTKQSLGIFKIFNSAGFFFIFNMA